MLEIFIAVILGLIAGCFTGIIPGIHINLVALVLFTNQEFFSFTTPLVLAIFIVSMAITHTFIDFIPSIFLGAPDEDTALSVLPGHELVLKGQGYGAARLTAIGSFFGLLIALAISPFLIIFIPYFYPLLKYAIAPILILISGFLILKENKKFWALFIFLISGILGVASFNLKVLSQPLFPLLSGLFGVSLLSISTIKNVQLPKQKIEKVEISKKETLRALRASIFSSSLVSFLPGVGSAQAAVISTGFGKISKKGFLVLLGAINTIVMCLSFIALYTISKPRTGIAVIIGKFMGQLNLQTLFLFLVVALVVGSLSVFLTLFFARIFSQKILKINYKILSITIISLIFVLTPLLSGPYGILILITATAIGIVTSIIGVRKMHMMGCLLVPTILYYLF